MTWVSLIILALKLFGPLIVELLKKLIENSHKLSVEDQALAKAQIADALKSGDQEKVKDTIESWHKKCEPGSVGCSMI